MADSPEFTAGKPIKSGVIWHDSPSWTGPSSSKIFSQRVPVKSIGAHNPTISGSNENYFEPPVDDEIFNDEEAEDSFDSMLSTKSQRSTVGQKSQKLVWKKEEGNKDLLDDLRQGVAAGKRSLEKLRVLKKKKKSDDSGSSAEADPSSPLKTPVSVKVSKTPTTQFRAPSHPLAHSTPKMPGMRVSRPMDPGSSQKVSFHDSFDDSVDDLDYQQPPKKTRPSPSTPRQRNNPSNPQRNKIEGREISDLVFQTPSVTAGSRSKSSLNDFSSRTISRGVIHTVSTPKSARKRPASNSGTPVFKKAKSTELMTKEPETAIPAPSKPSLMKSKSFQPTVDDDWDDDSIFL